MKNGSKFNCPAASFTPFIEIIFSVTDIRQDTMEVKFKKLTVEFNISWKHLPSLHVMETEKPLFKRAAEILFSMLCLKVIIIGTYTHTDTPHMWHCGL